MTNFIRYQILFMLLTIATALNGQNPPPVQIVPVSPTAASLGMFGAIPVGYYTGTADISVPIYELDLDGKKFPINIAYHTSGIKVAQEAGCVGLGWVLQGYGCITKEVRGWDDFELFPLGYYHNRNFPVPDEENFYNTIQGTSNECRDYANGIKDGEPDMFHFNFGNYGGTMFFQHIGIDKNTSNKAYPLFMKPKDNLQAEFNISDNSWKILDGDGYAYYFNTHEKTEFFQYSSNTNYQLTDISRKLILDYPRSPQTDIITAWYLDSIVSPHNHKIKFEYNEDYIYTLKQRQETVYHLLDVNFDYYASFLAHDVENYVYSCSKINQKLLKKIETDLLTIEIISDDRLDIESVDSSRRPQKISEIKVKDKFNTELKNISFEYEYAGKLSDYKSCRLYLKNINDFQGNEKHTYEFTYDRSSSLPDKFSNAIDSWGYYNGAPVVRKKWATTSHQSSTSSYITYIPEFHFKGISPFKPDQRTFDFKFLGKSLIVSDNDIVCGMLSSIKYPTGLTTCLEYEPHTHNNGSSSTVQQEQKRLGNAFYQNFLWDDEDENESLANTSPDFEFELLEKSSITLTCIATIYEAASEGYTSFYRCAFLKDETGKTIKEITLENSQLGQIQEYTLNLPVGKYKISIKKENIETPHKFALNVNVFRNVLNVGNDNIASKGGGVRVKRIYSLFEEELISDQKITYVKDGKSSGKLMNVPVFTYPYSTKDISFIQHGPLLTELIRVAGFYVCGQSYPYTPFSSSAMGASVGYSFVKVADGLANGYTEYSYYNVSDQPLSQSEFYIPGFPTYGSFSNGLLKSKIVYNDDDYKMEETNYDYGIDKISRIKAFKVCIPPVFSNISVDDYSTLHAKFYDVCSERCILLNEKVTTYSDYESTSGSVFKWYTYLQNNDLPSTIKTYNSDKSLGVIQHQYATDCTDLISQKMKNRNMVNTPLEIIHLKNGLVTRAEKTSYLDTLGMVLPHCMYNLSRTAPLPLSNYSSNYRKVYSIDKYNKYGKILQVRGIDNIPVCYLWGYKSIYPIAEIRNTTFDEVVFYVNNVDELEKSLSPSMSKIENLRNQLKKSMITTYTYKVPWGMQTVTAPNGMKTNYKYDSFGRLNSILDHTGNSVQNMFYNYKQ